MQSNAKQSKLLRDKELVLFEVGGLGERFEGCWFRDGLRLYVLIAQDNLMNDRPCSALVGLLLSLHLLGVA